VWQNPGGTGAVLSLIYNGNDVWYGLYYDAVSQDVTVIGINNSSSRPLSPTTIVVPDDYSTIQSAVNAASPGDTVYVRAGTYHENVQVRESLSLVGQSAQSTAIDGGNVQDVISVLADGVSITGFTISNDQSASKGFSDYADIMLSAASCSISGNVLTSSFAGVDLSGSAADNSIIGNEVTNNSWGIYIGAYSPANPTGVASGNSVIGNDMTDNNEGVGIGNLACDNSITGNNITANSAGLVLFESPYDNNITENTINKNAVGVNLRMIGSSAYNNVFYHNNFIGNGLQVMSGGQANVWDNGYPSGGNYWSDYKGTDLLNGPYQNQTGSDGIGDTAYVIDANNIDRYPLMGPCLSLYSSAAQASISCISNSTISGFQLSGATMNFNVSGEPGTTGFCTLTIPHLTLPPPYTMKINGNLVSYTIIYEDATESIIYFTYQHSTNKVTIAGAPIHDVGITNVTSSKTVVFQGFSLSLTVTAADLGSYMETFLVTVYAGTINIASQNVTLNSGESTTLTFTWNTTGFARGYYTISAYAWPVPGETNMANNNFTGGNVYVSMVGDLNCDGKVDGKDISIVALCFGSHPGDPTYNPNCDIFNRSVIDGRDVTIVANHFGEHDP
jgi:parallel beta-helix repeat protein